MTVNIEALMRSLGKPYKAIRDAGIITYKTPPQGTQCDPSLTLEMKKEGLFLSFDNDAQKTLSEITLELISGRQNGIYPNELPTPLKQEMSRQWVHENFGEPDKSIPPEVIFKRSFGWRDRFTVEDFHIPITMVILFGVDELAESVTFLPTAKLRW
jgi:hypothetical protein